MTALPLPRREAAIPEAARNPPALTISITPARAECLAALARLSSEHPRFNARLVSYTEDELRAWMAQPAHHVLQVRAGEWHEARDLMQAHPLVGLMVCHADEEDFIADGFVLDEALRGRGVERVMVRTLADLALASGCGAVVLPLRRSVMNLAARSFYASLGTDIESLPSGEMEVAFASLAADDVLARAEARSRKRTLRERRLKALANPASAAAFATHPPRSGSAAAPAAGA